MVELPARLENVDITMVDMTGKLITRKIGVSGIVQFSSYELAKGMYMLYIRAGAEVFINKVTIQ